MVHFNSAFLRFDDETIAWCNNSGRDKIPSVKFAHVFGKRNLAKLLLRVISDGERTTILLRFVNLSRSQRNLSAYIALSSKSSHEIERVEPVIRWLGGSVRGAHCPVVDAEFVHVSTSTSGFNISVKFEDANLAFPTAV
jgi:hypothetical protein